MKNRRKRDPRTLAPLRRSNLAYRARRQPGFPYGVLAVVLVLGALGIGIAV